jgi:branched-chain amino acid transport system substrate-binding protein
VADVNSRGGLNGHPVRVLMAEDGGDPARAQEIVRKMVEQDHVIAFFSPYTISTLDAVLPYLDSRKIPVYGSLIGADFKADYSEMVFNPFMGADKGLSWEVILSITKQTDKRKAALLYCREATICRYQRQKVKELLPYDGLTIVYEAEISVAQPDFTAETLAAQRAGAEIIMLNMDINSAGRVARSAHRQGYRPVFATAHQVQNDTTLSLSNELDGLILGSVTATYDSPQMAEYRAAIAKYQPNTIKSSYGAMTYVAGRLLEAKIAPLLDENPSSNEFIEALYSLQNETFKGLLPGVTWPRRSDRSDVNLCSIPVIMRGGRFVPHGAGEFICAPGWKPAG